MFHDVSLRDPGSWLPCFLVSMNGILRSFSIVRRLRSPFAIPDVVTDPWAAGKRV